MGSEVPSDTRTKVLFHGEFTSIDATAATTEEAGTGADACRITLYGAGSIAALTVGATDQVVVTDVATACKTALTVLAIYDGADDTRSAGENILVFENAAGIPNFTWSPVTPHFCQVGTYPKVETSAAGLVDVTIRGWIYRG